MTRLFPEGESSPVVVGVTAEACPAAASSSMSLPPRVVDVVDYGGGNTGSLIRALQRLGVSVQRKAGLAATQPEQQAAYPTGEHPLILPGVGAFGALMQQLHARDLVRPIQEHVAAGRPFLGVCVGLQVLFEASEESPDVDGLGLVRGQVRKFQGKKVPQMGWNWVSAQQPGWPDGFVYYVNSYYPVVTDETGVLYRSTYETTEGFCGAWRQENVTAFQFHPEKSGTFGQQLLATWLQQL